MTIIGVLGVLTTLAATAHLGLLSPLPIILSIIIYLPLAQRLPRATGSSPTSPHRSATSCWPACSVAGALPLTEAVLALDRQNLRALVGFTLVLEACFAGTFWIAKLSRRATREAIARLENARAQIHKRDALLHEARADLDRALDAAKLGRFTGQELGGFRLGHIIGRGTMGEVYDATRIGGGEPAAVKVLHRYLLGDDALIERFFREAEISSELSSPHIVRVLGNGQADDGSPFLAMELLQGEDLADVLRRHRAIGVRRTLQLVTEVAQGLSVAQDAGIVHRDLKPQNLFCAKHADDAASWKILDFGVAAIGELAGELTQGAAIGTPNYMSPEQARGQAVDHRSDVFSLGAIAYRCLTGRPAFAAPDSTSTMYHVLHVQPADPGRLTSLDPDVSLALALAIAKSRDDRFRSATTFASALRDASRGELDRPFREAAESILARHPWGTDDTEVGQS